ncbi:TIGR04104 family putative zinc finger protein [Macrococcus brunensis]|uniref:TIGR04104 family putative zinc finger protein n=1 Tax=Macrococcus brunensis TaxID=198483 RepID=UPI001EF0EEB9|nr:TIGR04104 family putative zinc finger protein [Macrococcus brunensis]ULG71407.1 hypothetical protein MGG12_08665 [Macrococcus brunensis]
MKCNVCNHHFSYGEKLKLVWRMTFNNEIQCPDCKKTYYISQKSLSVSYLILLAAQFILLMTINLLDVSVGGLFLITALMLVIIVFTFPFLIKIVNEPDGLLERQFQEMENKKKMGQR